MTTNGLMALDDVCAAVGVLRKPTVHLWAWLGVLGWWLIGDAVTTLYGLSIGLQESNALLAPIVEGIGALPALILFKAVILAVSVGVYLLLMRLHKPRIAAGIPLGLFAVGFAATAWNSYLILIVWGLI